MIVSMYSRGDLSGRLCKPVFRTSRLGLEHVKIYLENAKGNTAGRGCKVYLLGVNLCVFW